MSALNWHAVSPDWETIDAIGPDCRIAVYSVEPSEPKPIAGLRHDELPIRWTPSGRGLYVWDPSEMPARVSVVDVATGRRTLFKEILSPTRRGSSACGRS